MTTMNELTEQVQRALHLLQCEGIEGWGLNNPNEDLFDGIQTSNPMGCTSRSCNHVSHDAAEPMWKLVPREGVVLSCLTPEAEWYGDTYYLARRGENVTLLRFRRERNYWDQLDEIDPSNVPAFILTRLAEEKDQS